MFARRISQQTESEEMRDEERISRIVKKLQKVWEANPDWRLCQLVFNIANNTETMLSRDVFYVEDGIFEITLNHWIEKMEVKK